MSDSPLAANAASPPPSGRVTRWAVAFELGLGAAAVVVAWLIGYPLLATLRPTLASTALAVVATVPLLAALWALLACDWPPVRRLLEELERHLLPLFAGCSPFQLVAIACAAGIGEELLFRGLVQGAVAHLAGTAAGLIVASVLFGLAHAVTGTYAGLAAVVGLYLGGLAVVTGGVWVPIIVHALYDLVALRVWVRSHRPRMSSEPERNPD